MSHQLTALVDSSRILTEAEINRELERLDLPCRVTGMPPFTASHGEFAAAVTDRDAQHELHFDDARGWLDELPELRRRAGSRDLVVDFHLDADMAECFLVYAVCAALATGSDALCYYQPDDLYYSPQELVDEARGALAMVAEKGGGSARPGVTDKEIFADWQAAFPLLKRHKGSRRLLRIYDPVVFGIELRKFGSEYRPEFVAMSLLFGNGSTCGAAAPNAGGGLSVGWAPGEGSADRVRYAFAEARAGAS